MADPVHTTLRIADLIVALRSDQPTEALRLEPACKDFACTGAPDVVVVAHHGALPEISLREEERVFDSEAVWSLYAADGRYVFAFRSFVFGPEPYGLAVFDRDFRRADVYSRDVGSGPEAGPPPNPLAFPLSEVLMVCLLAQRRGLMVHACGIDDEGRGYLFAGNSTHGKTTTARLWRDRARILNDDRIVLRPRDGRLWLYGTPWHGDYTGVSPGGVPLERVFFLRHAAANEARPVTGAAAAAMLLARCFPPLWDAAGMAYTLEVCAQVAATVPCYDLGFVPDGAAVDFVRCVR